MNRQTLLSLTLALLTSLGSSFGATLTVELFLADSLVSGQGRTLLYRHTYDTAQVFTNITITPAAIVQAGDPLVATATDANGNTSEFSAAAAVTENHAPVVANPIPDGSGTYGSAFSYTFPTNTFSDSDAGDMLTYTASGLPTGISFDGPTRTFSGTPITFGTFSVTVTATDNGAPPLSTNDVFDIVVAKASLIATADNKSRLPGQSNPPLTGTLAGVTNNDNIAATFETTATPVSPPGNYPITPVFSDPGSRLPNYTIATNAGTLTVANCSMLAITNAALPNALEGTAYTVTVQAANGGAPYSFAVTGGALPGNLTLAANGLLSGIATNTGNFAIIITATDVFGCMVNSNYALTVVCPTITVNPAALPAPSRGVAYSRTITASGGGAPRTFAVTSGTLPTGLGLSSAGLLSGTPTVLGSSTFTVTATDAGGCTGSRSYTLNVSCPPLVLSPATLPVAIKDSAYSATFSTANGTAPYTYALISGALPGGLSLTSGGVICGAPTTTGVFSFSVRATEAGGCTVSSNYTLTLETPVYEGFNYTVNAALNGQNGGTGFSTAWGGASSFGIAQGSIQLQATEPNSGNALGIGSGTITRRLTQSLGTAGTVRYLSCLASFIYPFGAPTGERVGLVLNGTSGTGLFMGKPSVGSPFNVVLENAAGGSQIVGPALVVGPPSRTLRLVLKCEFFAGNDRFTLYVDPPFGPTEPVSGTVKFDSDLGTVTNIAFAVTSLQGSWRFDEIRMGSSFAVVMPSGPAITISPSLLSSGGFGAGYSQTLSGSGGTGPYTFAVTGGSLPNGLTLSSSGLLSGTPTNVGTFSFTITATDAQGCSGSRNYSFTVPCPSIAVGPASLLPGTAGSAYSQPFTASGGTAPYVFTVTAGALPPVLNLSAAGTLSGTPNSVGSYSFTITATDANNCSGSTFYSMSVTADNRWLGDGTANRWNFVAANWSKGLYQDGDIVLFDDFGSNNVPVDLTALVAPTSVTVNAAKSYSISGSGGITGATGWSKVNTGELKLATSNSYSGLTTVSDGRLTVQHNNALGTIAAGTTVINTGSLNIQGNGLTIPEPLSLNVPNVDNGFAPTNGVLNNLIGSNVWSGPITLGANSVIRSAAGVLTLSSATPMAGPGALRTAGAGDIVIASGIANSVATEQHYGTGTVTLTGTNESTGGILVYSQGKVIAAPRALGSGFISISGTLEIAAGGSASVTAPISLAVGKLRVSGGAVTYSRSGYPSVDNFNGGTFETASSGDHLILNSALTGSGSGAFGNLFVSGPGTVTVNAGNSSFNAFLGIWWVQGGILELNQVDALGKPGGGSQRPVNLSGGAIRTGVNTGGVFSIQTFLQGDAAIQPGRAASGAGVSNYFGDLIFSAGQLSVMPGLNLTPGSTADLGFGNVAALDSDALFNVQNVGGINARVTLNGVLTEGQNGYALGKTGNGTLVLAGANNYRGGTTVSNGTLRIINTNGSATGSGEVTVIEAGTLTGIGRIAGPVTIKSGGTLSPGNSIGTLTISNSLVFKAGSTNLMEVNLTASTRDLIARLTNVTYGGTLVLSRLGVQAYANGNSFKFFDSTSYRGVFATIQPQSPGAGLQWDITTLPVDGTLRVITGTNQPPVVANPIPDQNAFYAVPFNLTFATNTFTDPDTGQTLTYTASGMPPGITFDAATRTFAGATTARGTFEVTVIATDNGPSPLSTSDSFNIVMPDCPALVFGPGPFPQPTVGLAYTQTITVVGGVAPHSFFVSEGVLPAGLTLSVGGSLNGTATVAGNFLFTVTATDAENCIGFTNYAIFVRTNGPGTVDLIAARTGHTATLLPDGKLLVAGGTMPGVTLDEAEFYDPATGRWVQTAPMTTPRSSATATLLPNGKVLLTGGLAGDNVVTALASTELYDPATGTWNLTGSLSNPLYSHTATLLPDGKVLVVGGYNGDSTKLSAAELYDPATGTWAPTGSLNLGRYNHAVTLLSNGKVLVSGGYNYSVSGQILSSAELYDPATGTWTVTGGLASGRHIHTSTLLPNGKVLAVGGYNISGSPVSTAELYDPVTATWTTTGAPSTPRTTHTATLLPNGKLLIAGGNNNSVTVFSFELYDPASGTWSTNGTMTTPRSSHTATLLPNAKVLFVAGYDGSAYLSSAESYTPAIGTWTATGALAGQRYNHSANLLPNGMVLVAGGTSLPSTLSSAELYSPTNHAWTAANAMTTARQAHTATLLANGKVLVAGGGNFNPGEAGLLSSAELYDPISGTWLATGPMTDARWFHTATLLANGKVLVSGGIATNGPLESTELYDPAMGTWTLTGPLITARAAHTATLLPNAKVLVAGGEENGTNGLASAELYDPATGTWTATSPLSTARSAHTATVLPNGKVMVAGGTIPTNGTLIDLASTELYDPGAGTWTTTGPLGGARYNHTATLLPNGTVLVGAGHRNGSGPLSSAELYDPASETWKPTGALTNAYENRRAVLLPDGKVLMSGGRDAGSMTASGSELYDVGLGFNASWQPQIASVTSPLTPGASLVLNGSRFRGISEGSGGNLQDSPADYPVVQLRSVEGGQTRFIRPSSWSTNSFISVPVDNFPSGYALVTVFVNGIPSASGLVRIVDVLPPTEIRLTGMVLLPGGAFQCTFSNVPGLSFSLIATTNASLPFTSSPDPGSITEIAPGLYQVTDPQAVNYLRRFYRVHSP